MSSRLLRYPLTGPEPDDIILGDCVRAGWSGPVGFVKSIDGDHATVTRGNDKRDILPLKALRRAPPRGDKFDKRGDRG